MFKQFCYLTFIVFVLFSCKKAETPPIEPIKYSATIDLVKSAPGESATIRFNQAVKKQMLEVNLNAASVQAYSLNDSTFSFIVPVIPAGDYDVTFKDIALQSKINFSVRNYPIIAQPQVVIDSFSTAVNNSIDSLIKLSNSPVAPIDKAIIPIVKQFQDELNTSYAALTAAEKTQFAYFVREHKIDFASVSSTTLPAIYYNALTGKYSDPGEELVKVAKEVAVRATIAAGTIPVLLAASAIFVLSPNPFSASLLSASFLAYVIAREAASKKAEEAGKLNGVIEAIFDIGSNSLNRVQQNIHSQQSGYTNTSTIPEFKPDIAKVVTMKVEFRNLLKTDMGLHENISSAIKKDGELVNEDKNVATIFSKIKNLLKKVNLNWIIYSSKIPDTIIKKIAYVVPASSMSIKSVSDNRLLFTASSVDTGLLVKINSTVAEDINFNLLVGYKSSLINKNLEKAFPAKYLGFKIDTAAVLVSHGKWEAVSGTNYDGDSLNTIYTTYNLLNSQCPGIVLNENKDENLDFHLYNGNPKSAKLTLTGYSNRRDLLPNCTTSPFIKYPFTFSETFEWQYIPNLKVIRVKVTTPNSNGSIAYTGAILEFKILSFSNTKMEVQLFEGANNPSPTKWKYTFK